MASLLRTPEGPRLGEEEQWRRGGSSRCTVDRVTDTLTPHASKPEESAQSSWGELSSWSPCAWAHLHCVSWAPHEGSGGVVGEGGSNRTLVFIQTFGSKGADCFD